VLGLFAITHKFITFMVSGMYLDYIVKKFADIFVRNVLIYGATFFGEKFIIEFICRKSLDRITSYFSLWVVNKNYESSFFFHFLLYFFMAVILTFEF
jgi:ribosome biogenesis protein Nip4